MNSFCKTKYEITVAAICFIIMTAVFLLFHTPAFANDDFIGKVTRFNGVLSAVAPDKKVRALGRRSKVYQGDIVSTEKDSYAEIRFTDGSTITLRPESSVKVDDYFFREDKPEDDSAVVDLIKGGLRTITGKIGKRGNKESYVTKTPVATIGIRGTIFSVMFCAGGSCAGQQNLQQGMYVEVSNGAIVVNNNAGSAPMTAGQMGYLKSGNTKLEILTSDPGGVKFNTPVLNNTNKPASMENSSDPGQGCQM